MNEGLAVNGSCLCGAVTLTAYPVRRAITLCHCGMCRQWTGGPYMGIECHEPLALSDDAPVTRFPSSPWACRGFCNQCGSHLFFRTNNGHVLVVAAGLFQLDDGWQITDELFMETKPKYYALTGSQRQWIGDGVRRADD